jgi:hypothetical protein
MHADKTTTVCEAFYGEFGEVGDEEAGVVGGPVGLRDAVSYIAMRAAGYP